MVSYYGRRRTTDTDFGVTGTNTSNMRHSVFDAMPEHGWGHTFWLLAGRYGATTPTGRCDLTTVDSNGNPSARMAYSNTISFGSAMTYGGDGTLYSGTLAFTDTGYGSSSGVMMYSGKRYGIGYSATGAQLAHGMIAAASSPYANTSLYKKDSGSITPVSPFYTSSTNEGTMTISIGYDPNEQPNVPVNRSPVGNITTTVPTFGGDFVDNNAARGDLLKNYQVQLRQVGFSSTLWDTGTVVASGSEQSANRATIDYGGSALVGGTAYEWRIRVRDLFDAWSDWSSWLTITPSSPGVVGQGSTPVGKQTTQTPGPFILPYSHANNLNTNAVQIRLVQNGVVVQTSPIIANTVVPGTSMSIAWATAGFTSLPYGSTYAYEARARDTNNVWTDYGPNRTITINAYPNQPTITSPKSSVIVTALPLLVGSVTDPDDTAPLTTVQARIKNSSGTVLFTRTMTLRSGSSSVYEYQTTATDLASFATYKWDMRGYDGFLYGTYSAEATFAYATGPSVAITAPTANQVLTTSTPTIAWTAATQVTARADIFRSSDGGYVIGTNINSATQKTWSVPGGYLKNTASYFVVVTVTDASQLTGTTQVTFSLTYAIPAAMAGFSVTGLALAGDPKPSVAFMTWTAASDPTFQYYIIKRRFAGTLVGDPSEVLLKRITSVSQVTFTDTNPIAGQPYVYSLTKVITSGTDLLESTPTERELTVNFDAIIISSTKDGLNYRAALVYQTSGKYTHNDERTVFAPWGDPEPYIQIGAVDYQSMSASFRVINDRRGSAKDAMNDLRTLKARQANSVDTLCLRDGRGRRMFGYMTLSEGDEKLNQYTVDIGFIETAYKEGELT